MKIKTSAIVYGIRYIRRFGLRTLIIRIIEKKREKDSEYQSFYLETKASLEQLEKQRMEVSHWNKKEKISIVTPLYHTPAIFLRELIESVLESSYENWQLCFADATQDGDENQIENIVMAFSYMQNQMLHLNSLLLNICTLLIVLVYSFLFCQLSLFLNL